MFLQYRQVALLPAPELAQKTLKTKRSKKYLATIPPERREELMKLAIAEHDKVSKYTFEDLRKKGYGP